MANIDIRTRNITLMLSGDVIHVVAILDGRKYVICTTIHERFETAREIELCAADPNTNMTWQDAREIIRAICEAADSQRHAVESNDFGDTHILICMMITTVAVWGPIAAFLWWALG